MIIATNYARRQKFLLRGYLIGSWYATKQAKIMYAGTALWLTAVPFAIAACIWSMLRVSQRIWRLGEYLTKTRLMKDNCAIISPKVKLLQAAKLKMMPRGQVSWQQRTQSLQNRLAADIEDALEEWEQMRVK